mgnify:CR=1 FL=1
MALKIRLTRGGAKKRPHYSIVIAESTSPRDGRFIEKIGFYNPILPRDHKDRLTINLDKAKEWLAKGAQPSERVHSFLANAGLLKPLKRREDPMQSAPKKKAQERAAAEAAKAGEAA